MEVVRHKTYFAQKTLETMILCYPVKATMTQEEVEKGTVAFTPSLL